MRSRSSKDPSKRVSPTVYQVQQWLQATRARSTTPCYFRGRALPPFISPFLSGEKEFPITKGERSRLHYSHPERGAENQQDGLGRLESAKGVAEDQLVTFTPPSSLSLSSFFFLLSTRKGRKKLSFLYDLVSPSRHLPLSGFLPVPLLSPETMGRR